MSFLASIEGGIAAFLKYGPTALTAVQAVESQVGAGNGATKLQLALAAVLTVAHAGESVPVATVQAISGVIDTIVSTLNGLGVFKKAAPPAAVAVAAAPAV